MKGKSLIIIWVLVLGCFGFLPVWAQSSGELENVEIEIVKERKVSLPEAERKFSKISPQASEPISPPITYSFKPIEVTLPLANLIVRPLKLKQEAAEELGRGQLSVGYGNFASPYLEGFITSKKNAKQVVGAHALMDIWAKGPVDNRNSGNGKYGLSLFAKSFGDQLQTGAFASIDQSFWHYYGYPSASTPEAKDILHTFNRFDLGGTIGNAAKEKVAFTLDAHFGYLSDNFAAKESRVGFDFASRYTLSEMSKIKVDASYLLLSRQDELVNTKPRNLFQAGAVYSFSPLDKLLVDVGFNLAYENDSIDKDFHVYPQLMGTYALSSAIAVKAKLSGSMQAVSLNSLSKENPWLAPNVFIAHTNELISLTSSIEAKVTPTVRAEVGFSLSSLDNLYFYSNVASDPAMFELVYDNQATERLNFYGSVAYTLARKTNVGFRGDWFAYNTSSNVEPWHRPTYKVTFDAAHNFYKKLKVSTSFMLLGGMKAYDFAKGEQVVLDGAVDLSLRADYFVSDNFLIFLQGANVLSSDYSMYFNYPVRGVQVRAGISWSF
jgi:hypothetical protein